ncbi:GAF domain-containing protein, partial [Sulfurimonas sp. MAG313]
FHEISEIQQEILQMVADGRSKESIFTSLCKLSESLLPNSVASIMIKDEKTGLMSVLSAPIIPIEGHQALCGIKPGPGGGSCGNAVYKNQAQYVQNAFEDERWTELRQVAYDFNICSCWSMPVRNKTGEAVGTFALSSFEHRDPSSFHKMLLDVSAFIVGVVIRREDKVA